MNNCVLMGFFGFLHHMIVQVCLDGETEQRKNEFVAK